jgi:hypothetical protein
MTKYDKYFEESRKNFFNEYINEIESFISKYTKSRKIGFEKLLTLFEKKKKTLKELQISNNDIKTDLFKFNIISAFETIEREQLEPFEYFFKEKFDTIISDCEKLWVLHNKGSERKPCDLDFFNKRDKKEITLFLAEYYAVGDFISYLQSNEYKIINPNDNTEINFIENLKNNYENTNLELILSKLILELKLPKINNELFSLIIYGRTIKTINWTETDWKLVEIIKGLIHKKIINLIPEETIYMYIFSFFIYKSEEIQMSRLEAAYERAKSSNLSFIPFSQKTAEILAKYSQNLAIDI